MILHRFTAVASAVLALAGTQASRGPAAANGTASQVAAPTASRAPPGPATGMLTVHRADDGLFHLIATINGAPVRFVVDTGADVVVLTREDAARAGVDPSGGSFDGEVRTAAGPAAMAWTSLAHVSVAGRDFTRVDAAVPRAALPASLLGQNVLTRLGVVILDGDTLRITRAVRL